jgi:hypothetical protein
MPSQLTDAAVRNVIVTWYHGTNEHLPVEELKLLLTPDVEMSYPNSPTPIAARQASRDWYADVLAKYGAARSEYGAFLSRQLFTVVLLQDGQIMIQAKNVKTFAPTAPVFDIGT